MPEPLNNGGGEGEGQEVAQLKEKLAKLEGDLNNVVGELKTTRQAKTDAEAARDALEAKLKENAGNGNLKPEEVAEAAVQSALKKRDQETALTNRQKAEARFKSAHKEFHPDNDPGGLKYKAIEEKLSMFSTDKLASEEDFVNLLENALTLVNPASRKNPESEFKNPYSVDNRNPESNRRIVSDDGLSYEEDGLIKRMGWTKEQYLKVKTKRPGYVEGLLKYYN